MRRLTIISTLFGGAFIFGSSKIMAHEFGLEYITEWQTDFRGGYDWLNMLKTSANVSLTGALTFEASTISTVSTGPDIDAADLQGFSNIAADNIPLTFARLGLGLTIGNATLFAGINNVNEDYFTSEYTSFFTNSSCGISPTISCNYDIANYPLASWCVYYRQQFGRFSLQTSLYPGKGYYRLLGHDNLFTLRLKRDGIFSISSIDYRQNGIYCILGIALHYGVCIGDEDGESGQATSETPPAAPAKSFSAAPWFLTEVDLPSNLGLILHGSLSTVSVGCKGYAGVGVIFSGHRVQPGAALNYAHFTDADEIAFELSARLPILPDKLALQPTLHLIKTSANPIRALAALRLSLTL